MARGTYKKNISPARSIKRKRLPPQKKRNGRDKQTAYEGVYQRLKKGFGSGR